MPCCKPPWFQQKGRATPTRYLILNGDTPLLSEGTVRELLRVHEEEHAAVTVLTAILDEASGYGGRFDQEIWRTIGSDPTTSVEDRRR